MSQNLPEEQKTRKPKWRLILTILTLIIFGFIVYNLRSQISGVISDLGRVNAFALLLVIPIEFWNYDSHTRFLRRVYGILGEKASYRKLYRFTLELNFVNHILPSGGVSGISYFNVRAKSIGISVPKSTLTQVTKLLFLFASFMPLLVVGVFLLAIRGHTNNLIMVIASSLITALIIGFMLALYVVESRQRINATLTVLTKIINKTIHLVRRSKPETINIEKAQKAFIEVHDSYIILKGRWRELKMPFFYMTLANATEISAIYVVYIAFGHFVNVGAVILAYAVANFAGLISIFPAGIGVYEGLMTGVLVVTGIPAELSIPVTVMYRVVNMIIQLTPGYFLYQKALKRGLSTAD